MTYDKNCSFCNPKKKDWEEDIFYGYQCPGCQGDTAFIMTSEHRGQLNDEEKETLIKLAEKYYPKYKIKWITKNRKSLIHFYEFLVPK